MKTFEASVSIGGHLVYLASAFNILLHSGIKCSVLWKSTAATNTEPSFSDRLVPVFSLTVPGLHQLGVPIFSRLLLGCGAAAQGSFHLDPVRGRGVGRVVGVAGHIWGCRVVIWWYKRIYVRKKDRKSTQHFVRNAVFPLLRCYRGTPPRLKSQYHGYKINYVLYFV